MIVLVIVSLEDSSNELISVVDIDDSSVVEGISGRRRGFDMKEVFVSVWLFIFDDSVGSPYACSGSIFFCVSVFGVPEN